MPKDVKVPGAVARLAEASAKMGMKYGVQRLGLPDAEGRQTILGMDPFNKSRSSRPMSEAAFQKQSKEVQEQIKRLERQAEVARQKKDAATEKKAIDEISALMAAAPLGAELGPTRPGTFRAMAEEADIDYLDAIRAAQNQPPLGRARKSRKSKKSKKGGRKTRKAGKTRRH